MTTTKPDPVICRCPKCKREAPADIDHWNREFGEREYPGAPSPAIMICPSCGNREVEVVNSWWEVELDETAGYTIDEEDRPFIEKIVGVYLVNRAERAYLCSTTPSYWLVCIGSQVHLVDGVSDDTGSRIQDKYEVGALYDSNGYADCVDIDRLPDEQLHFLGEMEDCVDADAVVMEIDGQWWFN